MKLEVARSREARLDITDVELECSAVVKRRRRYEVKVLQLRLNEHRGH